MQEGILQPAEGLGSAQRGGRGGLMFCFSWDIHLLLHSHIITQSEGTSQTDRA